MILYVAKVRGSDPRRLDIMMFEHWTMTHQKKVKAAGICESLRLIETHLHITARTDLEIPPFLR